MAGPTGGSRAGRWASRARRGWWLIALPVTWLVWWTLGPFAASREVRVRLPDSDAARALNIAVRWERAGGAPSGAWVDRADGAGLWTQRLPARGVRAARLEWPARPGDPAPVAVQVGVADRVVGLVVARTQADASLSAEGGRVELGLPPRWRAEVVELALVYAVVLVVGAAWRLVPGSSAGVVRGKGGEGVTRAEVGALVGVMVLQLVSRVDAPMMFCPDSMDYAVRARELLEQRSFAGFDAWRPPGFAVLLALLTAVSQDFRGLLGGAHLVMVLATAAMAGSIVRRFAGGKWGAAAVALVGLDPLVMLWSRHAMPEMSAMFLATAAGWLAVRVVGAAGRSATSLRAGVAHAALVGATAAGAAWMRGNLQVLAPTLAGMVLLSPLGRRRRIAMACACVLGGVAVLGPWIVRNAAVSGVRSFVVGTQFARLLNGADAGLIDLNQAPILTRDEIGGDKGGDDGYAIARRVHRSAWGRQGEFRDGAGLHPWAASEARLGVVVDESLARRPDGAWRARAEAFASLSGLAPLDRKGYRENEWWARPLAGDAAAAKHGNFWNGPEDYPHLDRARAKAVYGANHADINRYQTGVLARLFGPWVRVGGWVRVGLAWAALLGGLWAARRGAWAEAVFLGVPFVHAGAVAIVTLSGIDRYQSALIPLTACAGVIGLSWLWRRVLGPAPSAVATVTSTPGGAG